MKIWQNFLKLFEGKMTTKERYFVNGVEVSQEVWYLNGGLEVEEELEAVRQEMENFKKRFTPL